MTQKLRLALLGGLRITLGEAPLPGLTSRKAQALLCYLALTRRSHTRDTLAALLWGDVPQEEARASLRNALFVLRKAVSPYLIVTRDTVAFSPGSPYELDVEDFLGRLAAASPTPAKGGPGPLATLREALALYEGDFLEGFYVPGALLFEEWVLIQRERLHGMAVEALYRLADESAHLGDTAAAIAYLNRLLVLEPWRERARRELMRLLAETGHRAAALAQYETCRRILLAELGVEPGEETTALYTQILAGEVKPRSHEAAQSAQSAQSNQSRSRTEPRPRSNLPAALTQLFGRDAELSQLADRLQRPALRLLTLVGEGGVGKTRLAIELASRLLPAFADGVFFVALSALHDAELVPSAIAQAVKLQERAGGDGSYLAALKEWLSDRKVLLVLDNFEQILGATGAVVDLLQAAPGLKIVVTSREPLSTIGEHVFPVSPLPVPDLLHPRPLESLDQYASIALFCARAEAARLGFALTEENAPGVTEICRRLDGSPLAIELAAAQAAEFEVDEIARRLGERFTLLSRGNRGAPDRHQTLRACIEWSYDLLAEGDRRLFRRLSVFAGGWTTEAAAAVAGQGDAPETETETETADVTRRLAAKSLVVLDPEAGRYSMHESIRHYAARKLEEAGEAEAVRARHVHHFMELAETAEQQFNGPDSVKWRDRLDAEHDNLRASFDWLEGRTGDMEENVTARMRLAGALWRFWLTRGHTEEGSRRLESILGGTLGGTLGANAVADERLSEPSRGPLLVTWSKALTGAGALAHARGDYGASRNYLERNLAVRRVLADQKGIASALNNLAHAVKGEGDLERARQLTEESLALKREIGDRTGIVHSLGTLGGIEYDRGDYSAARALYEESIALARESGHVQALMNELNNLGRVLLEMREQDDRASALFEESLALARELGDRPGVGRALGHLGQVAAEKGDYVRALSLQKESLEEFREAGHVREVWENLCDIALALVGLGHAAEAARLMGASEAARVATRYHLTPADEARIERGLAVIRTGTQPDANGRNAAYAEGLAMPLEQAIAAALQAPSPGQTPN